MNKFAMGAAIATSLLAVSSVAAVAAPVVALVNGPGVIPGVDGTEYNSPLENGKFTDTYTFTLLKSYDASVSFSGQLSLVPTTTVKGKKTATAAGLAGLTFGFYQNGKPVTEGGETAVANPTQIGTNLVGGTDSFILAPGTYSIIVNDTYAKASGTYDGTLSLSAVPLPNTVALFGVAVVALGVAGAARRKMGKASVSA